jgi:hypothetical protein
MISKQLIRLIYKVFSQDTGGSQEKRSWELVGFVTPRRKDLGSNLASRSC